MEAGPANEEGGATGGRGRGRGRGKSRGGFGKYMRARGRGHARGRPAEFGRRLVLEDEEEADLTDEEAKELERKYSKRQLGTNTDRYVEPEPELNSDGEPVFEPKVDLTTFLDKQRLSPQPSAAPPPPDDSDAIDESLASAYMLRRKDAVNTRKGRVQQVEWDDSLEELSREKAAADATRDLKARFKEKTEKERSRIFAKQPPARRVQQDKAYAQAPALPSDTPVPPKSEKETMEEFLDDLLD